MPNYYTNGINCLKKYAKDYIVKFDRFFVHYSVLSTKSDVFVLSKFTARLGPNQGMNSLSKQS